MGLSGSDSRVGTMFGPYELRALIGRGGMGEVYKAYDTVKDRMVALKLLRSDLAADTEFQNRFRRESRVAARLQEPHVIPVHDFGEIDGVLYIDMRLVEGPNVKTVISESGWLPPSRTVAILSQVAAALDAAHADGLVHRDVKTENVLLTASDFAYLVDFGIAHSGTDPSQTTGGTAVGSFAYAAPERFSPGPVGPAADVYSLACFLYECLTGEMPYPVREITQLMGAHLMAPPPRPSMVRPGLNPAFDNVVAIGMAKDPAARYLSAGDLAHAAAEVAGVSGPAGSVTGSAPALPAGWSSGNWAPDRMALAQKKRSAARNSTATAGVVAGAVLLVAAVGFGLYWMFRGSDGQPSEPTASTHAAAPTAASSRPGTTDAATSTGGSPSPSTSTASAPFGFPGADAHGFTDYPGAQCRDGDEAELLARTTYSVLAVCGSSDGQFYYRGVRLRDQAGIELPGAVRVDGGFDVVNPQDGTRYEVRPGGLTIVIGGKVAAVEPIVTFALR